MPCLEWQETLAMEMTNSKAADGDEAMGIGAEAGTVVVADEVMSG